MNEEDSVCPEELGELTMFFFASHDTYTASLSPPFITILSRSLQRLFNAYV